MQMIFFKMIFPRPHKPPLQATSIPYRLYEYVLDVSTVISRHFGNYFPALFSDLEKSIKTQNRAK